MKLNRRQIRSLIMEELSMTSKRKPLNEGIFSTVALIALGATAFAGLVGMEMLQFEAALDRLIENDPEMQSLLAELGSLVKDNPDMAPSDVAEMAARQDERIAERLQKLISKANIERAEVHSTFGSGSDTIGY